MCDAVIRWRGQSVLMKECFFSLNITNFSLPHVNFIFPRYLRHRLHNLHYNTIFFFNIVEVNENVVREIHANSDKVSLNINEVYVRMFVRGEKRKKKLPFGFMERENANIWKLKDLRNREGFWYFIAAHTIFLSFPFIPIYIIYQHPSRISLVIIPSFVSWLINPGGKTPLLQPSGLLKTRNRVYKPLTYTWHYTLYVKSIRIKVRIL